MLQIKIMILNNDNDNDDDIAMAMVRRWQRQPQLHFGSDDVPLLIAQTKYINRIKPMHNMFPDWKAYFPVMHLPFAAMKRGAMVK